MNEQQYTFARFWKCALQVNPHSYNENYRGQEHGMDAQAYAEGAMLISGVRADGRSGVPC